MVVRVKRESEIERELKRRVEAAGGICTKVAALGSRGFFDRLVLLPGGRVFFVELKRPRGGRFSEHQIWYAGQFEALGAVVVVIRNSSDIDAFLAHEKAATGTAGRGFD